MKKSLLTLGIVACVAFSSAAAWAQEDELKAYPGFFDFGSLAGTFGEPTVEIAVGKSLLKLVGAFTASEEPEVADLFSRLDGVRVQVFETEDLADGAFDLIKDVSSRLSSSGWESVVTINSDNEQVRIFMKLNDDRVEGITVMAVDPHEAAFINVIGVLDPSELAELMDRFDVEINGVKYRSDDDD
jgi:hypothetical protein